eukprot:scaffold462_cov195-Pinguiococcus_pyrenoidosus.AAC.102
MANEEPKQEFKKNQESSSSWRSPGGSSGARETLRGHFNAWGESGNREPFALRSLHSIGHSFLRDLPDRRLPVAPSTSSRINVPTCQVGPPFTRATELHGKRSEYSGVANESSSALKKLSILIGQQGAGEGHDLGRLLAAPMNPWRKRLRKKEQMQNSVKPFAPPWETPSMAQFRAGH